MWFFFVCGVNMWCLFGVCMMSFVTGDQMATSCILGFGGHFARAGQNCNYCEVHTDNLLKDDTSVPRTLARIYHQCHLFPPNSTEPFECPGCGAKFETVACVAGERQPSDMAEYVRTHAGSTWHRPPLLPIEPIKFIVCCLHLLLSLTKLLFKVAIVPMLLTEKLAQLLNDMLANLGVCIPKQKKVPRDACKNQSQRIKFTGAECLTLLEYWDPLVAELVKQSNQAQTLQPWADKA